MLLYHEPGKELYRRPFGAALCGSRVTLALKVTGAGRSAECTLETALDGGETVFTAMSAQITGQDVLFTGSAVMPEEPGLVFYRFRLTTAAGEVTVAPDADGNAAETDGDTAGWQITVYNDAPVPKWYRDGVCYQIFPDRFCRGENYRELYEAAAAAREGFRGPGRELVEDWETEPYYDRAAGGDVLNWPFWGGTLGGIREKLNYIKSLGADIIYLNPIFTAASNHKYDTADYFAVDPGFGGEDELCALIKDAKKLGINIILDGVFNHTGADSLYFDRYDNYHTGAYSRGDESRYRSWYRFTRWPDEFESWWGVKDLPAVNESEPGYMETVCGENGVIRYWLRRGIMGWRLDVADELPDSFIREIRKAAKAENPDAVIIGEVWEDASNKIAYGQRRHYFAGDELDGVMNYPMRRAVLDFLLGHSDATALRRTLDAQRSNYPQENYRASLNLLGSHDRVRLVTILGDSAEPAEKDRRGARLTPDMLALAIRREKLASLIQFCLPGVPSVYYGDEAGMQGFSDPYNRGPYPWGHENEELLGHYRMLGQLRHQFAALTEGRVEFSAPTPHVIAVTRSIRGERLVLVVNRGVFEHESVAIPAPGDAVDLLTGRIMKPERSRIRVEMEPTSALLLHFGGAGVRGEELKRSSGILCHITSIPHEDGEDLLDAPAKKFVDFLADSGQRLWQMLPLNPTGLGGSPYMSPAVFAFDPKLLGSERRLLSKPEEAGIDAANYVDFCRRNSYWLEDYALFTLFTELYGSPWTKWPAEIRNRTGLGDAYREHEKRLSDIKWTQFRISYRWQELKAYANDRGIRMIGDIPLYCAPDSADVWAHPEYFVLDGSGAPALTGGAPPDYFTPDGQNWGSPVYDWDAIKKDGWQWWRERFRAAADCFDTVRFDHFRGFSAYYAIPADGGAKDGQWFPGPGKDFFEAIAAGAEKLPVIAENLGHLDCCVDSLKNLLEFPGMMVWQFSAEEMERMPPEWQRKTVFYTGTHDNETLAGWFKANAPRRDPALACERVLDELCYSEAGWVIAQLQDVLALDNSARMNIPGLAEGNWKWRCPEGLLNEKLANELRRRAKRTRRA